MLLVAAVVGSGIMADRLSGGNAALALLANTAATAAALLALITALRQRVIMSASDKFNCADTADMNIFITSS